MWKDRLIKEIKEIKDIQRKVGNGIDDLFVYCTHKYIEFEKAKHTQYILWLETVTQIQWIPSIEQITLFQSKKLMKTPIDYANKQTNQPTDTSHLKQIKQKHLHRKQDGE